ncbi:MAG TPA: transketolase [Burkholderiaceae bacterium]
MPANIDQLCIDTLRFLSVDMVQKADSGHPGLPLDAAPMAYALWTRHLKHAPKSPLWADRDRFVLSAGHGSALLYSLLQVTGYGLTIDDLKQFRQWDSRTPGHPERGHTAGVEVTTGPLGQGLANAVGMAIAEAQLAATYNRDGHAIIDHRTWVIASDGDLMEGVAAEAISLAGHLKLHKLVVLYDDNEVTLSAGAGITFTEDKAARLRACGWHAIRVEDGNDVEAIDRALSEAQAQSGKPTLILVRTHLGFGSPKQDSYKAHGSPLGEEDVARTKQRLGWPAEPDFFVPEDAARKFGEAVERGAKLERDWQARFEAYRQAYPDLARELDDRLHGRLPDGWQQALPVFPADDKGMSTRVAGKKILAAIGPKLPALVGGSADLDPSTFTPLVGAGDFGPPPAADAKAIEGTDAGGISYAGRNLHFGVREHAMGAIVNGLAAHGGFVPYGATFLIFSDYMRPAIRLAALQKLHALQVFTHDSIALGEDGPTHQPVEQLMSLRAIPGLTTIRPADANETAVAWRVALEAKDRPVLLVFTRQDVPTLDRTRHASAEGLAKGAYVLADAEGGAPEIVLIASGSEVGLIVAAARTLAAEGVRARCVSMPCWDLFAQQPKEYRDAVLPPSAKRRLAVEAGTTLGWERWVGDEGDVIGLDHFGASAPAKKLLAEFGFSPEHVVERARRLLRR